MVLGAGVDVRVDTLVEAGVMWGVLVLVDTDFVVLV